MTIRPGFHWYVGDLRTGKISREVDLIESRWSADIGDAGTLEGSFPLRARKMSDGTPAWRWPRAESAPGKSFLAVSYINSAGDETFKAGGPIWTSEYDDSTGVLKIGAAALSSYFDHRKVVPVLAVGETASTATVTYTGAQLGLIAKRLVELAQSHTAGNLPIVLPDDADLGGAGADHSRTYPGYELGWVGERLQQLTDVIGGPEIQFVPRRKTSDPRYIEWVMRIGVEPTMILTSSGNPWTFDRRTPKTAVKEISVHTDASGLSFREWAAGEGEAEGRPIVYAEDQTLTDIGWPLLEGEVTATDSVSDLTTLNGHAAEELARSSRPSETWALTVARDARPSVGDYSPGDWARVRIGDHDYLEAGDYDMRILAISGDTTGDVKLAMVEKLAA